MMKLDVFECEKSFIFQLMTRKIEDQKMTGTSFLCICMKIRSTERWHESWKKFTIDNKIFSFIDKRLQNLIEILITAMCLNEFYALLAEEYVALLPMLDCLYKMNNLRYHCHVMQFEFHVLPKLLINCQ